MTLVLYPCLDCRRLTPQRLCTRCQGQRERARGSAAQRGYGGEHQAERARWAEVMAEGIVSCARCGDLIRPGQRWDLGHTDDREGWTGPEHATCNRAARGHRGSRNSFSRTLQTVTHLSARNTSGQMT